MSLHSGGSISVRNTGIQYKTTQYHNPREQNTNSDTKISSSLFFVVVIVITVLVIITVAIVVTIVFIKFVEKIIIRFLMTYTCSRSY